jgi:hypothetical protein
MRDLKSQNLSVNFTQLPARLDEHFEEFDVDNALRPTIITMGEKWSLKTQESLLSSPTDKTLQADEQDMLRDKNFDLLDSLSRSGTLPFEESSCHVLIALTRCFDQTLMDTVVKDNVNPVERVEWSSLLIASTTHSRPGQELLKSKYQLKISIKFPELGQLRNVVNLDLGSENSPGRTQEKFP